jgi:hypothetical protein
MQEAKKRQQAMLNAFRQQRSTFIQKSPVGAADSADGRWGEEEPEAEEEEVRPPQRVAAVLPC